MPKKEAKNDQGVLPSTEASSVNLDLMQGKRLFVLHVSGELSPHIFQPAVHRFVRSLSCEVVFPVLGRATCHLIFRGTEAKLKSVVDWLKGMPCGLQRLARLEVGEADDFISALKGNVRCWCCQHVA